MKILYLNGEIKINTKTCLFNQISKDDFRKHIQSFEDNLHFLSTLKIDCIDTPLGPLVAGTDDEALYFLEFVDTFFHQNKYVYFQYKFQKNLSFQTSSLIENLKQQLVLYFNKSLFKFSIPLKLYGTNFQKKVWEKLQTIPWGHTQSYSHVAEEINLPSESCRAVAQANKMNCLMILIPCHRIIYLNGQSGGYRPGLDRKKWLLAHEHY